jgi:Leucine-rich repeat (LRR) protein
VHDIVCELVAAQAEAESEASGGWAGYREVFLSAEVQDLIRARLEGAAAAASPVEELSNDGAPSPKKRKLEAGAAPAPPAAAAAAAPAPEVSWRVYCLDGTTFLVAVPEGTRVVEMKRAIGVLREVPHYAMELFVEGQEEPLDDEKQLLSAEKVPLFMLPKQVPDRLALEALFTSCGGAGWKNKGGWMTDAGLGEWHGVTVDVEGRVIKLDLNWNNLAGPLPTSELQQLSALRELHLNGNRLTGPVPAELGQLGALKDLHLHVNQLSGPIPAELGQLGALTHLALNNNQLSGPIPAELGQLGALKVLYLHQNHLSGPIPAELGQLGALKDLFLQGNQQLSGQEALLLHVQEHNPGCKFYC